jgi:hypothetical protein
MRINPNDDSSYDELFNSDDDRTNKGVDLVLSQLVNRIVLQEYQTNGTHNTAITYRPNAQQSLS